LVSINDTHIEERTGSEEKEKVREKVKEKVREKVRNA
jgi:hypothetical protein